MPKYFVAAALQLSLIFSIKTFSPGGFAPVMGSVSDSTGALTPRVTVKAIVVDITIFTTTLSNNA